ncbi:hypothetical protein [Polyangium jinanense]|uniref:Sulfatase-modifying factor enzyme domain-containing protein n=1 Tax=Polyangium jinanense TaxID=2829994 RepID=A0A9X3X334_9BACT|nr:hypothetical protein [Polyangium jinanense]MDC3980531.1 hypothetical protein [Polyangium jinanense]
MSVEPVFGEAAALLVSQAAGEPEGYARWVEESGRMGPIVRLVDENVVLAFTRSDGKRALVTSVGGDRLCLSVFDRASEVAEIRGCERVGDVKAVAVSGERVALISVETVGASGAVPPNSGPAAPQTTGPTTPAPKKEASPRLVQNRKTPAVVKKGNGKGGKKGGGKKKEVVKKAAPKPTVEVTVRWVSREGVFEGEAKATGLRFVPPLEGMGVVDARGSARGVEIVWYESAKPSAGKKATGMGWAAIGGGVIGEDGRFEGKSRAKVVEGELEWGALKGFYAPRLVGGTRVGLLTQPVARGGSCEVSWFGGAAAKLGRGECAIEPGAGVGFEKILQAEPRRVGGQARNDVGLVVWAGERAFFTTGDGRGLRSAGRDGSLREEGVAFPARRGRVHWAKVWPDGTGVALAGGRVRVLEGDGVREGLSKEEIFAGGRGAGAVAGIGKVGAAVWVARGDVGRVWPTGGTAEVWRGRVWPDGAVMVGGKAKGLLMELSGGRLHVAGLSEEGKVGAPALSDGRARSAASPVRAGFAAVERGAGGAIVAGVGVGSDEEVVAFVVDAAGRLGPVAKTSLKVRAGELGVRLSGLPGGGAILSDEGRRYAVWLDEEGREVGAAAWPEGGAAGICQDGSPGPRFYPSMKPGGFVEVEALSAPGTCVVGEPGWAADGSLRWFGTRAEGRDVVPEVGLVRGLAAAVERAGAEAAEDAEEVKAAAPRPCPPEMVLVQGKLCVDRFEATIVDAASREALSPDFPVTPNLLEITLGDWSTGRSRMGSVHARAMPLPFLPGWQRGQKLDVMAVPRRLARPNGYLTGLVAESACAASGKRLCTLPEFVLACRGQDDTPFPYGDTYVEGACNVFREAHPAAILHDNASIGHLDPRLNHVRAGEAPLFRRTGATPACRSRWGNDAIYDMVGNLDEWVDEGSGAFAGGFYARSTRSGCDAVVTAHPRSYLDYSTGVRCCKDAEP